VVSKVLKSSRRIKKKTRVSSAKNQKNPEKTKHPRLRFHAIFSERMKLLLLLLPLLALGGREKTLLENVRALALSKNKMTTGNRHAPVPQLTCKCTFLLCVCLFSN